MYEYPRPDGGVFRTSFELNPDQRKDFWYCDGTGFVRVGEVVNEDVVIEIACVGSMRWIVEHDDESKEVWRSPDDFPAWLDSDEAWDLWDLHSSTTVNFDENCWLEIRVESSLHEPPSESEVTDDIDDALYIAEKLAMAVRKSSE